MLDYLAPFKKSLKWDALLTLKKERDSWWQRESSQKWKIEKYPNLSHHDYDVELDQDAIKIGRDDLLSKSEQQQLIEAATKLIPWKKGPFQLFNLELDAEWRSDLKWQRLQKHLLPLKGKKVLDVGCNNGYFLFRMAAQKPTLALGIDPVLPMQAQFDLIQTYAKAPNTYFELFGVEHLPYFQEFFDTIFHMGIIYHHRHPIQQLIDIREALKPGGQAILETIGIPGNDSTALFPEDRYARMGNVWFVPTLSCFVNWAKKARFIDVEVIADTDLTQEEQRLTKWCPPPFQSLNDSLNPENPKLTIEGHPAPRRFLLSVRKKGGK
jgi:tRNA (mo5U34)-methyltransferase